MSNKIDVAHVNMVKVLFKDGDQIVSELDKRKAELVHAAMGISGESGEILDTIKKHTMYNKELDIPNLIEELGDMEFFMQALRDLTGISREETLVANIHKLSVRYPSGTFLNADAIERKDKLADGSGFFEQEQLDLKHLDSANMEVKL